MTKNDVVKIFIVLKTAYPNFYKDMKKEELEATMNLWAEMFGHENPLLVTEAVKSLINTFKWPPTIADIKEEMYKLTETETETPIEIWNKIKKAIGNSNYNSGTEFQCLPEIAKKFVGSPSQLREWAADIDFIDSVVRGQFLKQYEVLKQREKDSKLMLPSTKSIIQKLLNDIDSNQNLLN